MPERACVCELRLDRCDASCNQRMLEKTLYMACLDLTGRACLVVGAGPIGLEKISGLLAANAAVTVVATAAIREVRDLAAAARITLLERPYREDDLNGRILVVAATADQAVNQRVFADAERRSMLVNVVDTPPLCNLILPAIVRHGPIAVAVSTSGASPALAKRLRREVGEHVTPAHARLAEILNELRGWAKDTFPSYEARRDFFEGLVNGQPDPVVVLAAGDEAALRRLIAHRQAEAVAALQVA